MAPLAALPKPLRALLDDADFAGQEPVVFCGSCSPVTLTAGGCTDNPTYLCEAAGRRFTARYEARSSSEDDDADDDDDDYDDADVANKEKYGSGKKDKNKEKTPGSGGALKMSEALKGVNLYELISTTEGASQDEIKKAYRQMALTCHPDKQAQLEPAEQKKVAERFVMIQEAYELLSDPAKRMQYDSGLDFDDSLPKFKEGKQDFFEVFGEAFRRNARFSIRRPVPEVGSLKDTPGQWKKFYDFWFDFQSWRDPVILAENGGEEIHDLGAADCREEKRWMMKENARAAKHYKKEEVERIQKLVSLAESFDPRVLAEKEAKKAARAADAAKRDEERNAHKRARDEVQRLQQEAEEVERVAEEQKKKEEKVAREAIKERVKKCRQRVRSFHPSVKEHVVLEQLNEVCLQFEEQALKDLADGIDKALKKKGAAAAESAAALIYKAIESIGLTPIQVVEEDASTSGGPPSQEDLETPEEKQIREKQEKKRAKENEERRKKEETKLAAERVVREAEKAAERKIKEEARKKEQAAFDAKKRQQEKKEEDKVKKADQKLKQQGEQELLRREEQREEAKTKAAEQAEKDKAEAIVKKEANEAERIAQLLSTDRIERLNKLDLLTDKQLQAALSETFEADVTLRAAVLLLQQQPEEVEAEESLDRAMALVSNLGCVWPLGLVLPATIRLENALRNRVKKARNRLRDAMESFMATPQFLEASEYTSLADEWQTGIADGSIELPTWTPPEAKEEVAVEAQAEGPESPSAGKKSKKGKEKPKEENLDDLLAEFGVTPTASKKANKKK